MTFSGFGSYVIDAGGSWTLAGTNTLAANESLTNFGTLSGTLSLGSSSDRLIAESGSKITGLVKGGGGNAGTGERHRDDHRSGRDRHDIRGRIHDLQWFRVLRHRRRRRLDPGGNQHGGRRGHPDQQRIVDRRRFPLESGRDQRRGHRCLPRRRRIDHQWLGHERHRADLGCHRRPGGGERRGDTHQLRHDRRNRRGRGEAPVVRRPPDRGRRLGLHRNRSGRRRDSGTGERHGDNLRPGRRLQRVRKVRDRRRRRLDPDGDQRRGGDFGDRQRRPERRRNPDQRQRERRLPGRRRGR